MPYFIFWLFGPRRDSDRIAVSHMPFIDTYCSTYKCLILTFSGLSLERTPAPVSTVPTLMSSSPSIVAVMISSMPCYCVHFYSS